MTAPSHAPRPLEVALEPSLDVWLPEIRYTIRTVFGTAGFAVDLRWYENGACPDVYYGPRHDVEASISIPSVPWAFGDVRNRVPRAVADHGGIPRLLFAGAPDRVDVRSGARHVRFGSDVLYSAFWLLLGPQEPMLGRDRWDNLAALDSVLVRHDLLARPPVSLLAARLRELLDPAGVLATPWPWEDSGWALALTHDVDYPEIVRWIEVLRALAAGRPGLAWKVATGATDFWRFSEWVELANELGGRPAFYFMARQGSLLSYVRGRPDAFYDITSPRFRNLFAELRDAGCEIGLHASYEAHRSVDRIQSERDRLKAASGGPVPGNRHHFWHLDPDDPAETLRRHAEAGLEYDTSLAFETHPGFRRGICHPFRPYHPETRAPVGCVQLPPAWMDDHFVRRRRVNGIEDARSAADALVGAVERTGGVLVLNYHPRGMNPLFFPGYGPWLREYAMTRLGSAATLLPVRIAEAFIEREAMLESISIDRTEAT